MSHQSQRARFEREILPHLDAAHNLARWLLGGSDDAQDVVQEAVLRSYKYFAGFHGENGKAWLLRIVRHSCYDWVGRRPRMESMSPDEEGQLNPEHERALEEAGHGMPAPDAGLFQRADQAMMRDALESLPREHREILILREIEELSYKEIAAIADIPLGTVMSRLSRARDLLLQRLGHRLEVAS